MRAVEIRSGHIAAVQSWTQFGVRNLHSGAHTAIVIEKLLTATQIARVCGLPGPDDHPRIPSVIPPHPLSEFKYECLDTGNQIGTGGDANVYYATVNRNGESYPVAVKQPRYEGTLHQEVLDRVQNEAETWTSLDHHSNIVTVYSWNTAPVPWLALEYMAVVN